MLHLNNEVENSDKINSTTELQFLNIFLIMPRKKEKKTPNNRGKRSVLLAELYLGPKKKKNKKKENKKYKKKV